MGTSDGTVQGLVPLLEPRPMTDQCNIVLVAEGFTAAQRDDFINMCDDFITVLQAEPWFAVAGGAINLYRLDVDSDESGADDPEECEGDGTLVNTYFDAKYCNGVPPIRRCLSGDENIVRDELDDLLPQWHSAAVIVNVDSGGCASGNVFFTNAGSGWQDVILHELGHSAFGLADEYDYWSGCESENARTSSTEPNVSRSASIDTLKWRHLRTPGVPIPTQLNADCSLCNTAPNVLSDDTAIGMYEGARYEHCEMFRPAYTCRMRSSGSAFCRVCVEAIVADLGGFVDAQPVLEVVPTTLDFGEIAAGLTLYLAFEVRNVRSGHPMPMDISLGAPTGGFFYPDDTETEITLPAPVFESYTSKNVYVAFTAETVPSSPNGELLVSSSDGQEQMVMLSAESVLPVPVDTVLVVDRSGSMSDPTGVPGETKIDHAIEAGELYVSLLKESDQIGIVRYNHNSDASDVLLNMRTAGDLVTGGGRAAARAALDVANLNPDGSTSIGAGIINGSTLLANATADARALIVLTDGRQNTSPDVSDGQVVVESQTPDQRVFAVGLGLNQLEDTLYQIATVTNGVAQITGDLVDEREFLLQKMYVQILSDVSDEAFVRDPIEWLRPGHCKSTLVYLSEIDVACDFIITWRPSPEYPKYFKFWLEAPDGTIIDPSSTLPAVDYVQRERHAFYRVRFPFAPTAHKGHIGVWRVWLETIRGASEFLSTLRYSVMAKARSNFLLSGRVIQNDYRPGSQMTIVLEPRLFGQPVALDHPVQATVTRPDGVKRTITLDRDANTTYQAQYSDTPLIGPYRIDCDVGATSPAGNRVTRYRTMTGLIFIRRHGGGSGSGSGGQNGSDCNGGGTGGNGKGGGGPDQKDCDKSRHALRLLAQIIERCCKDSSRAQLDLKELRRATRILAHGIDIENDEE